MGLAVEAPLPFQFLPSGVLDRGVETDVLYRGVERGVPERGVARGVGVTAMSSPRLNLTRKMVMYIYLPTFQLLKFYQI